MSSPINYKFMVCQQCQIFLVFHAGILVLFLHLTKYVVVILVCRLSFKTFPVSQKYREKCFQISFPSSPLRCCYGSGVWDAPAVHEGDGQQRPHYGFLPWRNPHEDAEDAHPASNHFQPYHRCAGSHMHSMHTHKQCKHRTM